MSIIPATYNFPNHYKGSTFSPISIVFNFDITGATILCQLKNSARDTQVVYEWKTGVNITVVDASTGSIVLNQINIFDKSQATYVYDLQITFADGTCQTYLKGSVNVSQDISRV